MTRFRRLSHRRISRVLTALAILAAVCALDGPTADAARQQPSSDPSVLAQADKVGSYLGTAFRGVSALSPSDVWVAGYGSDGLPLVRHYDGATWTTVGRIPAQGSAGPTSIFALSDDDVWVSMYEDFYSRPLVEHWDGVSWQRQDIPSPGHINNLYHIWAASPTDVWAVGDYEPHGRVRALIEHFDGATWERQRVSAPPGVGEDLSGVGGTSADDVWAVGQRYDDDDGYWKALFLHWDGTSWQVKGRFGQPESAWLEDVDVISPDDAWAVGGYSNHLTGQRGLVMHWNGTHWSDTYTDALRNISLDGVSAVDPSDAWAVGMTVDGTNQARSAHWNGHSWKLVPVRNPGSTVNYLFAVSADAPDDVWAAGAFMNGDLSYRMIQHWDGTRWSR